MQVSTEGLAELRQLEGCRLDSYQCEAHRWTIGYGHTRGVAAGQRCTLEEAERWLREDLAEVQSAIARVVRAPLTQGQLDALCSLGLNVGAEGLAGSAVIRLLNAGDKLGAARQFGAWVFVRGEPIAVQLRDAGDAVREWQRQLAAAGFSVVVDGIFGPGTHSATKAWQAQKGLPVTGIGAGRPKVASGNLAKRRVIEVVRFLS